jgi:hypothetical protein
MSESRKVSGGVPLSEWSGSGATDRLRETIERYSDVTATQTAQLIRLTRALVTLTAILCIGLIVQIVLALTS